MIAGVADTHAALWYLFGDNRLSARAKKFIDDAGNAGKWIALSSISLVEIIYLIEKKRIPASSYDNLRKMLNDPEQIFKEAPLNAEIVAAMRQVPRDNVPDMPDRIVAATGIYYKSPIISRDGRIRAADLQTVW